MNTKNWDEMNVVAPREGVTRRSFSGGGATLAWTTLEPGHEPRPHSHPHEQIVYIIQGDVEFVVGDEHVQLAEGGIVVVPPDVEHYAINRGDVPVVDLSVFTPVRADYRAEESLS